MRCSLCGYEFDPDHAERACVGCPQVGDCHLIRCPHCGFETPPEAKLVGWLRGLQQRWQSRNQSSTGSVHHEA